MLETITHTPSWLEKAKAKDRPVFTLRAGSILERDQFEAELEGRHQAGLTLSFQLLDASITGIEALVGKEDGAAIIDLLRSDFASSSAGEKSDLSPKERAMLKEAMEILAKSWPDYKVLIEREARRNAILPSLAFMQWCDGWENVKDGQGKVIPYARNERGDIDEATLRRIPFVLIRSAGFEAHKLQYGRHEAKN